MAASLITEMFEIRFHGRGGQGAVTAAEILAEAANFDGKRCQAFPFFGVERRGAPVMAFTRISDKPILIHQQVYSPDYVVVLDPTLIKVIDVSEGLKKEGAIIINSTKSDFSFKAKTYTVDATKIALDILGKPIVNTVMLGAFAKSTGLITIPSLKKAIKHRFKGELAEKNIKAVEQAHVN